MRFRHRRRLSGELAELADSPTWMYPFELEPGRRVEVFHPELPSIHATRAAIIEPTVRAALANASGHATAVDLGCSEGWFSQRLLDWGAHRVVGYDIRPKNIRRAELVRDHLGLSSERLKFAVASIFDLGVEGTGRFDVALCLGLVYHLENPIGALRVARELTRGVCIVESQLTEQAAPIRHGWGVSGEYLDQEASWAAFFEPLDVQLGFSTAAHGGGVSLIPNRAALLQALDAAGFSRLEQLPVPAGSNVQYGEGHRLVVAAWP